MLAISCFELVFRHAYVNFGFLVRNFHAGFINNRLYFTVPWDWTFILLPTFTHFFIICCFFFIQYFCIMLTYVGFYICTSAIRNFDFCTINVLVKVVAFWEVFFHQKNELPTYVSLDGAGVGWICGVFFSFLVPLVQCIQDYVDGLHSSVLFHIWSFLYQIQPYC